MIKNCSYLLLNFINSFEYKLEYNVLLQIKIKIF